MNCNCNCKNGQDNLDFLVPYPGGTPADATYEIGLTHFTCCHRNMQLADPLHPVIAQLTATPVGAPIDLGNDAFCQEVQLAGTVTYCPCNSCSPQTEYVSKRICLPCSATTSPHPHARYSRCITKAYHGLSEQWRLRMLPDHKAMHQQNRNHYQHQCHTCRIIQ